MTDKCKDLCPHCGTESVDDPYHKVYPMPDGPYQGEPRCEIDGSILVDGEWIFECHKCDSRTDKLYGLFVPHLCKTCLGIVAKSGGICGKCGQPRVLCCC